MDELSKMARTWGQVSDAIFASLSEEAESILRRQSTELRFRSELSLPERQHFERVNLETNSSRERNARFIKVLKRPG